MTTIHQNVATSGKIGEIAGEVRHRANNPELARRDRAHLLTSSNGEPDSLVTLVLTAGAVSPHLTVQSMKQYSQDTRGR